MNENELHEAYLRIVNLLSEAEVLQTKNVTLEADNQRLLDALQSISSIALEPGDTYYEEYLETIGSIAQAAIAKATQEAE